MNSQLGQITSHSSQEEEQENENLVLRLNFPTLLDSNMDVLRGSGTLQVSQNWSAVS